MCNDTSHPAQIATLLAARNRLATALLLAGNDPDDVRAMAGTDTWGPVAGTCDHLLGHLPCRNDQPHKGGPDGLGCIHWGLTVADRHDASEGKATR